MSRPNQSEEGPSTADSRQSASTDASTPTIDNLSSDPSTPSTATSTELLPATSSSSTLLTSVNKATDTSSSMAVTTRTLTRTMSVSSTSTSDSDLLATASNDPAPAEPPFRMSAGEISATVVLCCFVFCGLAIMLYFRIRQNHARRRHNRLSVLAPDKDHGARPKSVGDSVIFSSKSARESIMYHPEDGRSYSPASKSREDLTPTTLIGQPPSGYRVERTDTIMMSDIEAKDEEGNSPVSPLIAPTPPRPVSSVSRTSERASLRREFSFEDKYQSPPAPAREIWLDRRSALSSNPPSDWPLAMPSHYGRGFLPRPSRGHQHTSSGGWPSVVQSQGFEDVPTRGG